MNIRKVINQAEVVPPWYGLAYRDLIRAQAIAYPIGLHLVVRWSRDLWYRFILPKPLWMERRMLEVRKTAYQEGFADGRIAMAGTVSQAFADGLEAGRPTE